MERLGYIAVGVVLVLVALGLRRIRWSEIRLPRFVSGKSAWTPRTKKLDTLECRISRCTGDDWRVVHCYEGLRIRCYDGGMGEFTPDAAAIKKAGSQTYPTSNHAPS